MMKAWNVVSTAVAVLALIAVGMLWSQTRALRAQMASAQQEAAEEIELGNVMLQFQIRLEKLYEAGQAGNWPLADFYLDEIEEGAEELFGKDVMEDGSNISDLMESLMPVELDRLAEALEGGRQEDFGPAFHRLTQVCNSCHRSTGHSYLVIAEPTAPLLSSQRFEVQPAR